MDYIKYYNLLPGDQIVQPIFKTGLTKHYSMYLGVDNNGIGWIAENHKILGVRLINTTIFFQNMPSISRIDRFYGTNEQRKQVVVRACKLAGKPYDLINYNCEHFITEALTGKPNSQQVVNFFGGCVLVLMALAFVRPR